MARPNLHHDELGWQRHNGRSCPVHSETLIRAQYRCGYVTPEEKAFLACQRRWSHANEPGDIVAYMVVEGAGE